MISTGFSKAFALHARTRPMRKQTFLALLASFVLVVPFGAQAQEFDNGIYYRLTTMWQGEGKSLDVVNDGVNNKLILADTGNYSGQYWKVTRLDDGSYRLTTQWQGEGKSLDVVNDGTNNRLQLADTGNYSGQHWRVVRQSNGYYRLTTDWQGEGRSLDVVNDGVNNKLQLADTGDFSGQYWKIAAQ
ncbi:RICIN domain-containing protein [Hoeflea ulvae]|uniref:RICIN domain-containing protein n=1 Tax=Hoeflea ulvae TaxID=2983764 RepID=A0ABT3YFH7_9HYPH|nr:RICIN domain-containing protein [Hoeflea ulvae]MCY0094633.1 RICIN domain-containing protein [Hoeflea ulvae]